MKTTCSFFSWPRALRGKLALTAFCMGVLSWHGHAAGFVDSFEGYAQGALDSTLVGGPNQGDNGGLNPWFGAAAPNLQVVNAEYGVLPHGGTNMIRGKYNGLYDNGQDWFNLSFRCAGGGIFDGNLVAEWWFYDPLGAGGGGDYVDYIALCSYDPVPADMDYDWSAWPAPGPQRLSLGTYALRFDTNIDATMYQARVVGATDGANEQGWFNLTNAPRSSGWHHARIVIGAPNGAETPASFYVDNMVTPALVHPVTHASGFNVLEVNADFGNTSGYFDDIAIQDQAMRPSIGAGPANSTVQAGGTATFSATGVNLGNPAGAISWQKDGTTLSNDGRISGANTATLVISSTVEADAGTYSCMVSNIAGVASASAALNILIPPTIDGQFPAGSTALASAGDTVHFSVTAHASNPINYQWRKDGSPLSDGGHISGATTANLTITGFDSSDLGVYSCHLSNAQGVADSSFVTLVLAVRPSINVQPTNQTVAAGATVTFVVGAAGPNLSYQWNKGSIPLSDSGRISGASTSTLTISSVIGTDASGYFCSITNASGHTNTAMAMLAVIELPVITTQPVSQVASNGSTVTFHVVASDTSPSYRWKRNGVVLSDGGDFSGAKTPDLTIQVNSTADAGIYACVVSNLAGAVTSTGAALRVNQAAFKFYDDFESYSIFHPINYGRINGTALDHNYGDNPPETDPWWGASPPNICVYYTGQEDVTAHSGNNMIGGAYASVSSSDNDESFLNLAYRFNGGQPYYGNILLEWYFYDNGLADYVDQFSLANFAGRLPATSDSSGYQIPSLPVQQLFIGPWPNLDTTKYQVALMGVNDGASGRISRNITGTTKYFNTTAVRSAGWHRARIVVGPADPATHAANASFFVDDMLNAVYSRDLPGTNVGFNAIHILSCSIFSPATTASAGFFDDVTFQAANDPLILEQPVSLTKNYGETATFAVAAMAAGYQWWKDGAPITGATKATLALGAVSSRDQGRYSCVVTGANGSLTTAAASLTVLGSPPVLNIAVAGPNIVITWSGSSTLQSATTVGGPYTDLTGVTSPYTDRAPLAQQRFFRLRK